MTMSDYYKVLVDTDRRDLMRISSYELGGFDYRLLWSAKPLQGTLHCDAISHVRLFVEKTNRAGDFVANPLSWPICSDRFVEIIRAHSPSAIETFDARIISKKDGVPIEGFQIVNVVDCVPCINLEMSKVSYDDDLGKQISGIYEFVLNRNAIPVDAHIFRASEWRFALFVTKQLASALTAAGMSGVAYLECQTSEGKGKRKGGRS